MSKFESKAKELLLRVDNLINSFEICEGRNGGTYYYAPDNILNQYHDLLLDVQTLFFSDSPLNPLYVRAMELNERRDDVVKRSGSEKRLDISDFNKIQKLLSRYIEYRHFLQAED